MLEVEAVTDTVGFVQVKSEGVERLNENENGAGAIIPVVAVALHPRASVAVSEYVPVVKPEAELPVPPAGDQE